MASHRSDTQSARWEVDKLIRRPKPGIGVALDERRVCACSMLKHLLWSPLGVCCRVCVCVRRRCTGPGYIKYIKHKVWAVAPFGQRLPSFFTDDDDRHHRGSEGVKGRCDWLPDSQRDSLEFIWISNQEWKETVDWYNSRVLYWLCQIGEGQDGVCIDPCGSSHLCWGCTIVLQRLETWQMST